MKGSKDIFYWILFSFWVISRMESKGANWCQRCRSIAQTWSLIWQLKFRWGKSKSRGTAYILTDATWILRILILTPRIEILIFAISMTIISCQIFKLLRCFILKSQHWLLDACDVFQQIKLYFFYSWIALLFEYLVCVQWNTYQMEFKPFNSIEKQCNRKY